MIVLDPLTSLQAVLAGAVSANQPEVHVTYVDWNINNEESAPATSPTALSSAVDVTILAAPTQNPRREVRAWSIYNKDTSPVTVTIKTDNGTERIIQKKVLATLETLWWEKGVGVYVTNA
jgi:hypothetical protein